MANRQVMLVKQFLKKFFLFMFMRFSENRKATFAVEGVLSAQRVTASIASWFFLEETQFS